MIVGFKEALKRAILQGLDTGDLSTAHILVTILVAGIIGLYIYFIYRVTSKNSFYSRSFNKSLAIMPLITSGILMTMQTNLVVSFGTLGALSIVRFRNAVKEPMDLVFLFWSISIGIICGAGIYELVFLLSLMVTIMILFLDLIPSLKAPCLLVISATDASVEDEISGIVKKYCKGANTKSRSITQNGLDLILELSLKQEKEIVKEISEVNGVKSVNILNHDGELRF